MKKGLLSSMMEMAGFAAIGLLFFVWFLGHNKNNTETVNDQMNNNLATTKAAMGISAPGSDVRSGNTSEYSNSNDYVRSNYQAPKPVTRSADIYHEKAAAKGESSLRAAAAQKSVDRQTTSSAALRSWKGVHRDESFAWLCFERFGEDVASLSQKYGLYPDVFMARLIAYSYEYTKDPRVDPADKNIPALADPKGRSRARFRSSLESLKAYAVVNAGEIKRLSKEGAIAKNDRAWTIRKLIDKHRFVSDLSLNAADANYRGMVGPANKVSKKETYQREVVGEAIKMVSTVDDVVKKRRAETAGYSNWDDYLEELSPEEREQAKKQAASTTSAVSKKKAFNLSRRVDAKKKKD